MRFTMSKFWALVPSSLIRLLGLAGLVSLGGCSDNWGWYVVNPTTETDTEEDKTDEGGKIFVGEFCTETPPT